MAFLIGILLAVSVGVFASLTGFDRDRAFYPTVMVVIALIYVLYAVIGGSVKVLALEIAVMIAFVVVAVMGFKRSLWLVVAALVGHGVFDAVHNELFLNPGVPAWWPHFCLAYDVTAGLYLAVLLRTFRPHVRA